MIQETLAGWLHNPVFGRIAFAALKALGVEFPRSVQFGEGLELAHGAVGLVIHERAHLGSRVRLYQGVTIGRSDVYRFDVGAEGRVVVGDDVIIGANACVLFRSGATLTVGDRAVIGAGSIVTANVPAGEIWAGSPARCVGKRPVD